MEIKPANVNGIANIYKKNMNGADSKTAESIHNTANTDVVSFSEEGIRQSEFGKIVRTIAAEVSADSPADRIQSLRASIEAGTYSVTGEMIADAILSRVSA